VLQCVAVQQCVVAVALSAAVKEKGTSVCCSVLQCVAVRCSALQCVALCCSVLQYLAVCCSD